MLDHDLRINTGEKVVSVTGDIESGFAILTNKSTYQASRVLFAIGAMELPRRIGVKEDLRIRFIIFLSILTGHSRDALVVGGGNSAAEARCSFPKRRPHDHGNLAGRLGEQRSKAGGDETLGA